MRVLVVNAGSSSLKLRLLDGNDMREQSAELPSQDDSVDAAHLTSLLADWPVPDAVGHRIVHGGTAYSGATVIDPEVRQRLGELTALAPLHQPKSLAALDAVTALLPDVVATASFDTAFHSSIPAAAATYAIPLEWRERFGIRRYGFHGLSHSYAATRAAELLGRPLAELRIVTCHLGAGASLAAVHGGRSVDTTMGFTPLEGLVMATRSGSIDPGIVLWLAEQQHLSARAISAALEQESGLSALAGTGDMREVEALAAKGDAAACLAIDVYTHRLVGAIAAMSAATRGLDALVFTGGVGEHSALVRSRAAQGLAYLGMHIDAHGNCGADGDCDITARGAGFNTFVIEAREDLQIAREARSLLRRT